MSLLQLNIASNDNSLLDFSLCKLVDSEWYKSAYEWVKKRYPRPDMEVRIKLSVHAALKLFRLLWGSDEALSVDRSQKETVVTLAALLAAMDYVPPGWGRVFGEEELYWDICAALDHTHKFGKLPLIEAEIVRLALKLDHMEINSKYAISGSGSVRSVNMQKGINKPVEIHFGCDDRLGFVQIGKLYEETLAGSRIEPYVKTRVFVKGKEMVS